MDGLPGAFEFSHEGLKQRLFPVDDPRRPVLSHDGFMTAAVLFLIIPRAGEPFDLVLMRRTRDKRDRHSGEISFPGGRQEPGESLVETALRECEEEFGIARDAVHVIGSFDDYSTPKKYIITPIVGWVESDVAMHKNDREVDEIIGGGGSMEPRSMVRLVQEKLNQGFKAFKIRMDWGSMRQDVNPKKDVEMFRDVKSVLNKDCMLSFDANNGYTVPTAIAQGKKFQDLDIYHFEEPVAQYDYDGLKAVCEALDVPVSAGEHEYTRWQFHDLITKAGVDIIQPDVVKCAGLSEMRRIIILGEIHDKIIVPHQTQPAIGNIANLHACSATRSCTRPLEFTGRRPYLDLLFHGLPDIHDGWISIPSRPGLGIDADEEALEELLFQG